MKRFREYLCDQMLDVGVIEKRHNYGKESWLQKQCLHAANDGNNQVRINNLVYDEWYDFICSWCHDSELGWDCICSYVIDGVCYIDVSIEW